MALEIKRLKLATLQGLDGSRWPVHGFVVTHPGGAVLVDTGVGGPRHVLDDWRVVNRTVADALGDLDMSPADIGLVINTHLHFDHCGQNAVFSHAPFYVQRTELDRMRREAGELHDWFGFMNARFELLDGDTEILPGLSGGELTEYVVHLDSDDLSLGTYSIPAGGTDDQSPHTEDEIYVVKTGRATLVTDSGTAAVAPGSVIYVPAGETHRFTDVTEDLALIVVFAPPYGSRSLPG